MGAVTGFAIAEEMSRVNALVMNCSPVRSGATAEIVYIVSECLKKKYEVTSVGIDDFDINFCKGYRSCHRTAKCIQHDDVDFIIESIEHFYGHWRYSCERSIDYRL